MPCGISSRIRNYPTFVRTAARRSICPTQGSGQHTSRVGRYLPYLSTVLYVHTFARPYEYSTIYLYLALEGT